MKYQLVFCASALICASAALADPQINAPVVAGTLKIENAFTRPTLGGATVAVGYMTIVNAGKTDDKLLSVTSDISATTEIHESKMVGGVMEMDELPNGLAIPAGGAVAFKPGSYHLMFVGLKQAVKPGAAIHATLDFAKAGKVAVIFPAANSFGAMAPSGMDGMKMDGMKMQ
ncbi:MAG: copper chaperone PCu(A)C [Pseudomonadota bacterium]